MDPTGPGISETGAETRLTREQVRWLLRAHLVAGHVVADPDGTRALARENLRRTRAVDPRAAVWLDRLDQWAALLDGPLLDLLAVLTSPSPRSRELRQNMPFAGVLSEEERQRVERTLRALLGDLPPLPEVCHRWPLCPCDCPAPGCRDIRAWQARLTKSDSPQALDEELDAELIRHRAASDNGHRTELDEVITTLGYDRAQREAEDPLAGAAVTGHDDHLTRDQVRSLLLGYGVASRVAADPAGARALAWENLRRMRQSVARGTTLPWFDEWERLLDGPLLELLEALTSPSPLSRELRQNTPFAGVLSEHERQRVREVLRHLDDAGDVALIRARGTTNSGQRVDLDKVITTLGYNRAELEAELDAESGTGDASRSTETGEQFVDITGVRVLAGYMLQLTWADGAVTRIKAEPYLHGPALGPLRDPAVFATVTVDPDAGTVVWPNGADISPVELRRAGRPVSAATPAEPTASRDEVLAARDRLRRLAADHRISRPRVDVIGTVVVTLPADDPGYRSLTHFAAAAAEVVGGWVNVVADDAPAAATDTTPL
ncbi:MULTISPECIES: DUF2442 domain-containing protein [unclassified Modestobacter]|uniref:DUF2442 domain-containing protein n=1 Tax=unclassified Modestobacter TaxID=2643866 RepID=UPI0022AAC0A8|nr:MULTISPECIES: DUF2442 domain-containing protein [unclassified Modestobacter]MCZ2826007.1 DUF2442 domain-containing protein [Modestobacter sp. VKM Ac-2981]MCZ2852928.1 DUF2442 domain-containing protein [Modestobacter sp. VKM Ac-2982]